MPEQEGLGTIMTIRREHRDARIIAMSGGGRVGNLDVLEAAQTLGADDIISKPFEPEDLLERINRLATADASGPTVPKEDPGIALRRLVERSRSASRAQC